MDQGTPAMLDRIPDVRLSKGDRMIAESGARTGEQAVEIICRASAVVRAVLRHVCGAVAHGSPVQRGSKPA
jgi:hypothetical protein